MRCAAGPPAGGASSAGPPEGGASSLRRFGPLATAPGPALLAEPERLLSIFAEHGVCHLPGLLPADDVAQLRQAMVALLVTAGVLESDLGDAVGGGMATGGAAAGGAGTGAAGLLPAAGAAELAPDLYRRVFALPALHRLVHHPRLKALASLLLGTEDLLVHPRPACRVVLPASVASAAPATPPHQDHLGMQGTTSVVVAWIPLVECPLELGPIAVAAGSHLGERRPYRPVPGARVLTCDADDLAGSWCSAPCSPGDVIAFHGLSVHAALPNRSPTVRLSIDARYQPAGDPVCELTVRDDPLLSWDRVYAGLPEGSAAAAWRSRTLQLVPFDASVLRQPPA